MDVPRRQKLYEGSMKPGVKNKIKLPIVARLESRTNKKGPNAVVGRFSQSHDIGGICESYSRRLDQHLCRPVE